MGKSEQNYKEINEDYNIKNVLLINVLSTNDIIYKNYKEDNRYINY